MTLAANTDGYSSIDADSGNTSIVTVDGKKTVIIEAGNLYIASDMKYATPEDAIVFIVRRGNPGKREYTR